MFSGCAGNQLKHYEGTRPQADIQAYFNGPIKAWGIVQDWRGRVVRRFDVTMVGEWRGDIGTLTERFEYYDGERQQRVWTIKKLADGRYEGTAADILDKATGQAEGSAVRWNYVMDLPVDGRTYRLRFDDWMWAMNDGVLINRSYLKKFGITVAELTIFMQRQKPNE
ncbi:MAG: DUF3833 domain-containing protein [Burkholderiaceae bacterium]|jgi:hypothetical protein